jgi:hypothetical protein
LGYFFDCKRYALNLTKKGFWGTFWAIFFTNSSGHPAAQRRQRLLGASQPSSLAAETLETKKMKMKI